MGPPILNSQQQSQSTASDERHSIILHMDRAPEPHGAHRNSQGTTVSPPPGEKSSEERLRFRPHNNRAETPSHGFQERRFGLLRDSLVFNHERLLQNNPSQDDDDYTDQNSTTITAYDSSSPHYTSLSTFGIQSAFSVMDSQNESNDSNEQHPEPKLYSVQQDSQQQTQQELDADANFNNGAESNGWLQNLLARRNPPQGEDIQNALERANLIRCVDAMSGKESQEIPLTGTAASLHLPSPPNSLHDGLDPLNKQPSATTVTTVYSYKCERSRSPSNAVAHSEDDKRGIPLPTLYQGEFIPTPNTKVAPTDGAVGFYHETGLTRISHNGSYPSHLESIADASDETTGGDQPENPHPIDNDYDDVQTKRHDQTNVIASVLGDYATVVAKLSGMRLSAANGGSGDYYFDQGDGPCGEERALQPCLNSRQNWRQPHQRQQHRHEVDWNAVAHPSRDMYGPVQAFQYYARKQIMGRNHPSCVWFHNVPRTQSDDDFDEDTSATRGQSQPVFPNPAELKWPEPSYLRMTLPPKFHPFLASNFKKDCRVWLYKNRTGRKARELLLGTGTSVAKGLPSTKSNTSLRNQRVSHQSPLEAPNHTLKAFTDNDLEEEDELEQERPSPHKLAKNPEEAHMQDYNPVKKDHFKY